MSCGEIEARTTLEIQQVALPDDASQCRYQSDFACQRDHRGADLAFGLRGRRLLRHDPDVEHIACGDALDLLRPEESRTQVDREAKDSELRLPLPSPTSEARPVGE